MNSTIKLTIVVVGAGVALVASVFTAFATQSAPARAGSDMSPGTSPRASQPQAPADACTQMQATGIAWVTLTADHHVDKQVPSYASGTSRITPIFQYNCAPTNTVVVSVFSLNGRTIFTDKETIAPHSFASLYGYALETVDGTPLSDGQWDVEYFNDKTLLTTGSVVVGRANSDPSQSTTVTVQGVIQDQASQTPIQGANILVLNPGLKPQDFIQNGEKLSDVYSAGKTDSQGAFTLVKKLERHRVYSVIVTAQGYKLLGNETFQVNDEPDPVSITIGMTK